MLRGFVVLNGLFLKLDRLFETEVEIPRIKHGNKQELETIINEECLLFAKNLRNEIPQWKPRLPQLTPIFSKL